MTTIEERISAFSRLRNYLLHLPDEEFQTIAVNTRQENPWFTEDNVRLAFRGITAFLEETVLIPWMKTYSLPPQSKRIAIVMAGNIPLVGFHDLLCVLISGHTALLKTSSKDSALIKLVVNKLLQLEPKFQDSIHFVERLADFDAVIATGSDNSSRYFDYYFGKYPNIIRKNRTSIAILDGHESDSDLKNLGIDVFTYFGLGCRNVSKLFVPEGYVFNNLFESWTDYHDIIHHHKYCNNYDYQKSIMLVNSTPFLDNGFVMLHETDRLVSPISVVYFETYKSQESLTEKLKAAQDKVQCIVGRTAMASVPFGSAQFPRIDDYADQIDTMKFLSTIN